MSDAYPSEELPYGLYEFLDSTTNQLRPIPPSAAWTRGEVEAADQARVLALYVAQRLEHHLGQKATAAERVSIVNDVLAALDPSDRVDLTGNELNQLVALLPQGADQPRRPRTPLNDVALLTNSPKEPSLVREIARELESADRVDLLISFLKVSGVNLLRPALTRIRDRGIPFRVLTTTYMGATDAKAIRILAEEFGAEIKISYHQASTRLHAKAWIFERDSGFTTAYVGSSNLSAAAMTEGLEWNVAQVIALLVTLEKTEKQYSPQTMYKDYALTEREFAWDSQNVTTPESRRGRLYRQLEPGWTPVLFVRGRKNGDIGVQPYTFLGEVSYVSHEGSQPMHVRWELARPMPADIYAVARLAA